MIDNKDIMEFHKSSLENQKQLSLKESAKKEEAIKKNRAFYSKYYSAVNERNAKDMEHNELISSARNNALSTCLKAIYISALEANTLTDDGVLLAEKLVDNYIAEKGGAEKIFNECADRSYLLSRLSMIVEDSAKKETEEIEKINVDELGETDDPIDDDDDDKDDNDTADDEALDDASGNTEKDEEKEDVDSKLDEKPEEEEKEEESSEDEKEEDDSDEDDEPEDDDDEDNEESEGEENLRTAGTTDDDTEDVEDNDIDSKLDDNDESEESDEEVDVDVELDSDDKSEDEAPEEEAGEESSEEDVVIDSDEDNGSKDASVNDTDEEGKTSTTIYDELENEEDVQKAVELIRNRVADAEEAFIKRNAEDKQTMDNLLNKISDNVKTVEKIADNDSTKSKIAKENVQMAHRQIGELHNKPQSIFECMVRNLSSSIVKDDEVKQNYLNESGSINMTSIIESAKIMYAFLETLNTLQIERVDGEYIKKALEQI